MTDLTNAPDEVDRIISAWNRELPELDVTPMGVLSRVSRLARLLDFARREAFANHGVESWEFDVLSALRRSGVPYQLSPGALLEQTLVTSGTMTNRVDRLEARSLVRRLPDPSDGRGVIVELTADGKEIVDSTLRELLTWEHTILARMSSQEQGQLAGLLHKLMLTFEATD